MKEENLIEPITREEEPLTICQLPIRPTINWLEKRLRRSGPIAAVYDSVKDKLNAEEDEGSGRLAVLGAISENYGPGIREFVEKYLTFCVDKESAEATEALFCTAALCAHDFPEAAKVYLTAWQQLRDIIGLSDDPVAAFDNFPHYHVGSWRARYFGTILNFFAQLPTRKPDYQALTASQFETEYMQELVVPVLRLFQQFYELGETSEAALWEKVEQKIKFLAEKAGWREDLMGMKDQYLKLSTMANFCLSYDQRRLVIPKSEQHPLTRYRGCRWGYRCYNTIPALEKLIYKVAMKRFEQRKNS